MPSPSLPQRWKRPIPAPLRHRLRGAWLKALSRRDPVRGPDGLRLELGSSHLRRLLVEERYEFEEIALIRQVVGPTDSVLEAGAGLGVTTCLLAARTGGQVVSVEPCEQNRDFVRRNLARNGLIARLVPCAIGPEGGNACVAGSGLSARARASEPSGPGQAPCRSLAAVCSVWKLASVHRCSSATSRAPSMRRCRRPPT